MSKDKYNKRYLARFKKEIEKRIDELNENMDDFDFQEVVEINEKQKKTKKKLLGDYYGSKKIL